MLWMLSRTNFSTAWTKCINEVWIPYLYADDLKVVYSYKPEALSENLSWIQNDPNNLTIWREKMAIST